MNKILRLFAKVIDMLLFLILSVFCASFVVFITSFFKIIDFTKILNITDPNLLTPEYMQNLLLTDTKFGTIMIFISMIGFLLAYILYFGWLGKKCSGSPGKYALMLHVVPIDDKPLTIRRLLRREPILYFISFQFIMLTLSAVIKITVFVNIGPMIFLLLFILDKEFWNIMQKTIVVK